MERLSPGSVDVRKMTGTTWPLRADRVATLGSKRSSMPMRALMASRCLRCASVGFGRAGAGRRRTGGLASTPAKNTGAGRRYVGTLGGPASTMKCGMPKQTQSVHSCFVRTVRPISTSVCLALCLCAKKWMARVISKIHAHTCTCNKLVRFWFRSEVHRPNTGLR